MDFRITMASCGRHLSPLLVDSCCSLRQGVSPLTSWATHPSWPRVARREHSKSPTILPAVWRSLSTRTRGETKLPAQCPPGGSSVTWTPRRARLRPRVRESKPVRCHRHPAFVAWRVRMRAGPRRAACIAWKSAPFGTTILAGRWISRCGPSWIGPNSRSARVSSFVSIRFSSWRHPWRIATAVTGSTTSAVCTIRLL